MKRRTLRYWTAMNATAFDSAVHSLVVYGGASTAHQAAQEFGINVAAFTLQQFGIIFLSAFGWAILKYIEAHPLADLVAAVPHHEDAIDRVDRELSASAPSAPLREKNEISLAQRGISAPVNAVPNPQNPKE